MIMPVARVGDRTQGICSVEGHGAQGGTIISGSENIICNNRPVARVGDMVVADCGDIASIISGSPSRIGNNKAIARVTSQVAGGTYTGIIISGSNDYLVP